MKQSKYNLKKQPVQERSRFTVDVIRQAAVHILKEGGINKFTTNKVARKAGVSIGSLYQYFPSKEALIAEVKRKHFGVLRNLFKNAYEKSKDESLPIITKTLIHASIKAHRMDPLLHKILSDDILAIPVKENDHSETSIRYLIEKVLTAHKKNLRCGLDISTAGMLIYKIIECVIHDTSTQAPESLNNSSIEDELCILIVAYLTPSAHETEQKVTRISTQINNPEG